MWQVAVLWCYVEGVITVKVAARAATFTVITPYSNLYCCILLVFFLHHFEIKRSIFLLQCSRVCYNEQFLSIKSRCYNEGGGILSADVARACA